MGTALPALFFGSTTARRQTLAAHLLGTGRRAICALRFAGPVAKPTRFRCYTLSQHHRGVGRGLPGTDRTSNPCFLPERPFPRAGPPLLARDFLW